MVSHKIALTAIFLLAFECFSVLTVAIGDCAGGIITAPLVGAASPPCQVVIPAVIRAVFQPEPAPLVPSVGNYAPAPPPIIVEEDSDSWQNLLYLLMFAKNNKRSGGYNGGCNGGYNGYNYGWNCGCGNNCGGYDCCSIPYPYPYNGCSGGYDYTYPDDCTIPLTNPREINLVIRADCGNCTCG